MKKLFCLAAEEFLFYKIGKMANFVEKALATASAFLAHRTGFEPATYRIGICCSIQLSYRSKCGK